MDYLFELSVYFALPPFLFFFFFFLKHFPFSRQTEKAGDRKELPPPPDFWRLGRGWPRSPLGARVAGEQEEHQGSVSPWGLADDGLVSRAPAELPQSPRQGTGSCRTHREPPGTALGTRNWEIIQEFPPAFPKLSQKWTA